MKRKKILSLIAAMSASAIIISGCGATKSADSECLYQTALLQSLMLGDYYGSVSVKELKTYGNTGIGTFDGLNGELVMIDGKVYSGLSDGTLKEMGDEVLVPFSDVTFLEKDITAELEDVTSMDDLKEKLDLIIKDEGKNYFYMAKIDADFDYIQYRSEIAQSKPYKPLADVMLTDQVVFEENNVKGSLIALYCPAYMDQLNTPGWHLHYISDGRDKGGHVLDMKFVSADVIIDKTMNFKMILPDEEFFNKLDLTQDLDSQINKVEQNK